MSNSFRELAVTLRRTALKMEQAVRKAEKETAEQALRIARELSSGTYTSAQLARMGHPYATRNPHPPGDPALINAHTGRFRDAWKIRGPRKSPKGLVTKLVNDSPEAAFLGLSGGTSRMIARPIKQRIVERLRRDRKNRLARVLRQVLKGR